MDYRDLESSEIEELKQLYETPWEMMRAGPKGYCAPKIYKDIASDILDMELRDGDVFVCTFMRSGTTWTQELVWMVANHCNYEKALADTLSTRFPFLEMSITLPIFACNPGLPKSADEKAQLEYILEISKPRCIAEMPSPRFIKTHLPLSLLPPKLLDVAKMVYVARDPRDVVVSLFHFLRFYKLRNFVASFRQTWSAFTNSLFMFNPYFEHVKEAWTLRNHPNMLFLFYEELSTDLPGSIRRVAKFLGKVLTDDQIERFSDHLSIDSFKNNVKVNWEGVGQHNILDPRESFIRKGKAGNWREYFDDELKLEAERWIKTNLQGTDLRFPSMENELN